MTSWVSLLDWTHAYIEQYGRYPRKFNVSTVSTVLSFASSWAQTEMKRLSSLRFYYLHLSSTPHVCRWRSSRKLHKNDLIKWLHVAYAFFQLARWNNNLKILESVYLIIMQLKWMYQMFVSKHMKALILHVPRAKLWPIKCQVHHL
jgi:hypothetical protein